MRGKAGINLIVVALILRLMEKCGGCGAPIRGKRFCTACGAKVEGARSGNADKGTRRLPLWVLVGGVAVAVLVVVGGARSWLDKASFEHYQEELESLAGTYSCENPNSPYAVLRLTKEGEYTVTNPTSSAPNSPVHTVGGSWGLSGNNLDFAQNSVDGKEQSSITWFRDTVDVDRKALYDPQGKLYWRRTGE